MVDILKFYIENSTVSVTAVKVTTFRETFYRVRIGIENVAHVFFYDINSNRLSTHAENSHVLDVQIELEIAQRIENFNL
jgi:hypothetical protein